MKTKTENYLLSKESVLGIWIILNGFSQPNAFFPSKDTASLDSITPDKIFSLLSIAVHVDSHFSVHCFPGPNDEE